MSESLHIGILVEARYREQSQPAGLISALRKRGIRVSVIDPQTASCAMGDDGWLDGLDLIVARGRSYSLLCLLAWAESRGVRTINTKQSIAAVHNKAEMSVKLAAGNLPMPRSFFGNINRLVEETTRASYPLILKPVFGDNCAGLRVVGSADEMRRVEWREPVALAQSFLPTDGYDLNLYSIGDAVWAVRKPSPLDRINRTSCDGLFAELLPLTKELEEMARQCGEMFGLELFGVDCIETENGPVIIEVNNYPNYTGVPRASECLADYVISRALQESLL
ncbi:MAG TPA: ATP-grasp domain-containing protein [Blastocatellia bacterium]|nr:ATP-grasp domain-containing protein [Blastocatellia bacterium]